jgi:hypothetical protein
MHATVPEWWAYPSNYCGYGYLVTTDFGWTRHNIYIYIYIYIYIFASTGGGLHELWDVGSDWSLELFAQDYNHHRLRSLATASTQHWQPLQSAAATSDSFWTVLRLLLIYLQCRSSFLSDLIWSDLSLSRLSSNWPSQSSFCSVHGSFWSMVRFRSSFFWSDLSL